MSLTRLESSRKVKYLSIAYWIRILPNITNKGKGKRLHHIYSLILPSAVLLRSIMILTNAHRCF